MTGSPTTRGREAAPYSFDCDAVVFAAVEGSGNVRKKKQSLQSLISLRGVELPFLQRCKFNCPSSKSRHPDYYGGFGEKHRRPREEKIKPASSSFLILKSIVFYVCLPADRHIQSRLNNMFHGLIRSAISHRRYACSVLCVSTGHWPRCFFFFLNIGSSDIGKSPNRAFLNEVFADVDFTTCTGFTACDTSLYVNAARYWLRGAVIEYMWRSS